EVDDAAEDLVDLAGEDQGLGDLDEDLEDLAPGDGGGGALPGGGEGVAVLLGDVVLEVEVAVEVGDRPDERGGRLPHDRDGREGPDRGGLLPDGEGERP